MVNALQLFSLKGKVAIVTGGTSGIGRTVAQYLASAGAAVAVVSRHQDPCEKTAQALSETYGVPCRGYACDVTDESAVDTMTAAVADELGVADVLFNNAGVNINGGALEQSFADWKRVMDVNVNGVYLVARSVARWLVAAGKPGSIINTASISASIVNLPQWQTAYNTSKAAVLHMTKTLAVEWMEHRIRVNAVSPGYVWTEMNQVVPAEITRVWMDATPAHRFAQPDEIAGAVIYFASDASTYTSGAELIVDGAFTCL